MQSERQRLSTITEENITINRDHDTNLRRADFKIGVILFALASAFTIHTLGFPMSGSYGGVENQWFVSPALFPLIVLGVLLICSALLIAVAIRQGGATRLFSLPGWIGDPGNLATVNKWYVVGILGLYVYVYVPSVDFYLSTVLFLMSLMFRFYIDFRPGLIFILSAHACLTCLLFLLRLLFASEFYFFSLEPNSDEKLILWGDIGITITILTMACALFYKRAVPLRTLIRLLALVSVVPLILIIVFSFFLQVPMPVEYGTVANLLNYIAYDVIGI